MEERNILHTIERGRLPELVLEGVHHEAL